MTISDLLKLAQARLAYLNSRMATAASLGDNGAIEMLNAEISDTEQTINTLQGLDA
jgi:hypothetical protein